MEVSELLQQTHKLPNVPDVVRELIQQLNNPNADYGEISEKVSKDQTMSLKILRLVNSAHFGLSRKVSSIDEAVVMLGMTQLKTLVIASGLAGSVSEVEGMNLKEFWSQSFRIATIAKWYASKTDNVDPDMAFTIGLIHNIGRLLLHLTKPKLAEAIQQRVKESGTSRSAAEMERLNFTTPEAGQALLDLWKFPEELGQAVRYHKNPMEAEPPNPACAVTNIACYLNACIRSKRSLEETMERFPLKVAALAGLPADIASSCEEAMALESGLDGLAG